jgi:quinol monooxygenase YgiN
MLVVIATMTAQAGKEQEMEKALLDIIPKVDGEAGTLAYVLHRVKKEPRKFIIYEKYRDKESLQHHGATPYFAELFGKIGPLLDGNPSIEICEMLSAIKEKA